MTEPPTSVLVLYNQVGEDEYQHLKHVDPKTLGFEPVYPLDVATSAEEYRAIVKALRSEGFKVRAANVREDLGRLERLLRRNRPDVIFNLVEFFHESAELEAAVAGLFELYQIPYTGAPPFALALCQRKGLTKQVLLANGVPTPKFRSLTEARIPRRHGLRYPLIVKPAREDASAGVDEKAVVHDYAELQARLEHVFAEFRPPVLVEEFIEGRELHVGVFGNDAPEVLPAVEFDFSDLPADYPAIISYEAKWDPLQEIYHRVHSVCPAKVSRRAWKKVQDVCLRAYRVCGCRDYARLDIRLANSHPYILEVNPNPDLTEGVSFMESAEVAGYPFPEALRRIVEMALARKPHEAPAPAEPAPPVDPLPPN